MCVRMGVCVPTRSQFASPTFYTRLSLCLGGYPSERFYVLTSTCARSCVCLRRCVCFVPISADVSMAGCCAYTLHAGALVGSGAHNRSPQRAAKPLQVQGAVVPRGGQVNVAKTQPLVHSFRGARLPSPPLPPPSPRRWLRNETRKALRICVRLHS